MSELHDPIDVRFIGGRLVLVLRAIEWRGPHPITVPAGMLSDGGSIPAIGWPIVGHPFSASTLIAYLTHDRELELQVPWRDATRHLDARLRALQIARARRWAIVAAVRLKGMLAR